MIYSDYSIHEALEAGHIVIEPKPEAIQVQPASVDLRLGNKWSYYIPPPRFPAYDDEGLVVRKGVWGDDRISDILIDPDKDVTGVMRHIEADEFILGPGGFVLGTTCERVEMPANLVGRVEGRSSLGRLGLMVHITAGYIDPGFTGNITLEFHNVCPWPIVLRKGTRICQISFETMTCAAREPYGKKKGSKYQNQDGPVPSRIHKDEE